MTPEPEPVAVKTLTTLGRTRETTAAKFRDAVGVAVGTGVGVGVAVGGGVGVGVDVGTGVEVGVGVGVGVGNGVGVGVEVGNGVGVGLVVGAGVEVGIVSMVAPTLAATVASMSGVGVAVGVGSAASTAAATVASMFGVGDCWQAIKKPVPIPNRTTRTNRRIPPL